jgi:hypothetical protein
MLAARRHAFFNFLRYYSALKRLALGLTAAL